MSRLLAILIAVVSLSLSVGVIVGESSVPQPAIAATGTVASVDTSFLRSIDRKLGNLDAQRKLLSSMLSVMKESVNEENHNRDYYLARLQAINRVEREMNSHLATLTATSKATNATLASLSTAVTQSGVLTYQSRGVAKMIYCVAFPNDAVCTQ